MSACFRAVISPLAVLALLWWHVYWYPLWPLSEVCDMSLITFWHSCSQTETGLEILCSCVMFSERNKQKIKTIQIAFVLVTELIPNDGDIQLELQAGRCHPRPRNEHIVALVKFKLKICTRPSLCDWLYDWWKLSKPLWPAECCVISYHHLPKIMAKKSSPLSVQ